MVINPAMTDTVKIATAINTTKFKIAE